MLGGGNPVGGGNPAGTGTLNFVGEHAFAYSGEVLDNASSSSANVEVLKFKMPANTYVVAKLSWITSTSGNAARYISISQNGEVIYSGRYDDVAPANTNEVHALLLEPESEYVFKFGSGSSETITFMLVGRAYQ